MLTKKDLTPAVCRNLVDQYGTIEAAAKAIAPNCTSTTVYRGQPCSWATVKRWIGDSLELGRNLDILVPADSERVNRVAELLSRANIDPDAIGSIKSVRVKAWGYAMKGPDGEPIEGGLHATNVLLEPPAPEFPVITPADPTVIKFQSPPRILRKTRSVVVISDMQIGWLRDLDSDELEPIHDPDAIAVAQQIVADVQPDELVFIGDTVDLPMFSRWTQHSEFRGTLQATIDTAHRELATFISAAGKRCKKRTLIGSNHDHRIEKSVLEYNKEALNVRRAGDVDGWPVFSFGYLARLDDLGIEWSGQYPGGEHYVTPDLVAMHAPPRAKEFQASVIHGHTHSLSRSTDVQHTHEGRRTYATYDVGCLCQVGVTKNKHRLLVTRTPSDRGRTSWAQGIGVVSIVDGERPRHAVELVEIRDGRALYRGTEYEAPSLADAVA